MLDLCKHGTYSSKNLTCPYDSELLADCIQLSVVMTVCSPCVTALWPESLVTQVWLFPSNHTAV